MSDTVSERFAMHDERMFPIQGETDTTNRVRRPSGQVPWGVAEAAYATYVKWYGSNQSLQDLADRGGFGWSELVNLLMGSKEWKAVPGSRSTRPTK